MHQTLIQVLEPLFVEALRVDLMHLLFGEGFEARAQCECPTANRLHRSRDACSVKVSAPDERLWANRGQALWQINRSKTAALSERLGSNFLDTSRQHQQQGRPSSSAPGNELLCSKQHEHTNTHDIHTWDQAVTSAGSSTVMRLNAPVRGQQHDQGEFCTRSIDASQVWRALRSTTKWLGRPRTTRSRTIEGSLRDGANAPREGNPQ